MALDSTGIDQSHKAHRTRQAGPKKKAKSDKKKKNISENDRKQNPKVPLASFILIVLHVCYFSSLECVNLSNLRTYYV